MIFSIMSWNMCLESKAAGQVKTYQLVISPSTGGDNFGNVFSGSDTVSKMNTYSSTMTLPASKTMALMYIGYIDEGGNFKALPRDTELTFDFQLVLSDPSINILKGSATSRKYFYTSENILSYDMDNSQLVNTTLYKGTSNPSTGEGVMGNTVSYNFVYTSSVDFLLRPTVVVSQYFTMNPNDDVKYNCSYNITVNGTVSFVVDRTEKEILEDINKDTTEQKEQAKEQTETQKGIFNSIKEFFAGFFQNLIDSVVHLFVPTSEEMSGLLEQLNQFFSDTFGFLYAPFDYFIQLVNVFLSADAGTGLTLPGFSIMGHEVWADQTYDLSSDPLVGQIFGYVRTGTGVLLACWFIMYLQNFFKERFGKG